MLCSEQLKITLAQLNCKVGDIDGNCSQIVDAAACCTDDFLLTPELSICGYPPEDLLAYDEFIAACEKGAKGVATDLADSVPASLCVVLGLPRRIGDRLYNVVQVINQGRVVAEHRKVHLPNYGVFDEMRYFTKGEGPTILDWNGKRIVLAICHDIWMKEFQDSVERISPDIVLVSNASPFYMGVQSDRERNTSALSKNNILLAYANLVGGQDEHVFDGGSHFAQDGKVIQKAMSFRKDLLSSDSKRNEKELPEIEQIEAALCIGVRDYVNAAGAGPVFIGVSGGIDSAVVLCVAVQALGAENVQAVLLPSRFTAQISVEDGKKLSKNLGVKHITIDIESSVAVLRNSMHEALGPSPQGIAMENLQSRIRGNMLMTLANNENGLVLTTGNKSEMATGYATLYGDMAGAFDVLKDLTKQRVYELARHFNQEKERIPPRIIERLPTAELRADQLDSDSLPEYELLDKILEAIVEKLESPSMVADQFGVSETRQFSRLLGASEFKRRQAAIGPTLTKRAFGKDWRMPVANRYILGDEPDE